jgi:hypothetical protein
MPRRTSSRGMKFSFTRDHPQRRSNSAGHRELPQGHSHHFPDNQRRAGGCQHPVKSGGGSTKKCPKRRSDWGATSARNAKVILAAAAAGALSKSQVFTKMVGGVKNVVAVWGLVGAVSVCHVEIPRQSSLQREEIGGRFAEKEQGVCVPSPQDDDAALGWGEPSARGLRGRWPQSRGIRGRRAQAARHDQHRRCGRRRYC